VSVTRQFGKHQTSELAACLQKLRTLSHTSQQTYGASVYKGYVVYRNINRPMYTQKPFVPLFV
jgi:hypothetical protein